MVKLAWDTEYKAYSYSTVAINPKNSGDINNAYGVIVARSSQEVKGLVMEMFKKSTGYDCGSVEAVMLNLEELGTLVCVIS